MAKSPLLSCSLDELTYTISLIGIAFFYLIAGLGTMHTSGLSSSVPPFVMSLFKYFFCFLTVNSTSRVFLVLPSHNLFVNAAFELFNLLLVLFLFSMEPIFHFFPKSKYVCLLATLSLMLYPVLLPSRYVALFHRLLTFPSLRICATWLRIYMLHHKETNFLLPVLDSTASAIPGQEADNILSARNRKTTKFALAMAGTILFQSYLSLSSFKHVLAFIYLAMSWLATITLLSLSNDFGVFNFILTNVIIGSTVAVFGLRVHTWLIAYPASILLYRLRLELKSVSFIQGRFDLRGLIVYYILFFINLSGVCILIYLELAYRAGTSVRVRNL